MKSLYFSVFTFFVFIPYLLYSSSGYKSFYSMSLGTSLVAQEHDESFVRPTVSIYEVPVVGSLDIEFGSIVDLEVKDAVKSSIGIGRKIIGPIFLDFGLSYYSGIMRSVDESYSFSFASSSAFLGLISIINNKSSFVPHIGFDIGFSRVLSDFDLLLKKFTEGTISNFISSDLLDSTINEVVKYVKYGITFQFDVGVSYKLLNNLSMGVGYSYMSLFNIVDFVKAKLCEFVELNQYNNFNNVKKIAVDISRGRDFSLNIPSLATEDLLKAKKHSHFIELSTRFAF